MDELIEKLLCETAVNELDVKRGIRNLATAGIIGAAAAGLGYQKGMQSKDAEGPVEEPPAVSAPEVIETPPEEISKEEAPEEEAPKKEVVIDMDKVASIESSNNPDTPDSPAGARGWFQIMRPTWEEMVSKMGEDWSWEEAHDAEKNKAVATYYFNEEIPRLLKHYNIEDTVENRLAANNWGVGNLNRLGIDKAPQETIDYIEKYRNL